MLLVALTMVVWKGGDGGTFRDGGVTTGRPADHRAAPTVLASSHALRLDHFLFLRV